MKGSKNQLPLHALGIMNTSILKSTSLHLLKLVITISFYLSPATFTFCSPFGIFIDIEYSSSFDKDCTILPPPNTFLDASGLVGLSFFFSFFTFNMDFPMPSLRQWTGFSFFFEIGWHALKGFYPHFVSCLERVQKAPLLFSYLL